MHENVHSTAADFANLCSLHLPSSKEKACSMFLQNSGISLKTTKQYNLEDQHQLLNCCEDLRSHNPTIFNAEMTSFKQQKR